MSDRLDLEKPRTLGALIGDSLRLYGAHFLVFLAIGFAVVAPAELIVAGVGLGQFGAAFDAHRPLAARLIPGVVRVLVIAPLVAAAVMHALTARRRGERMHAGRALQSALDDYRHLFVPVAAAFLAEAVFLVPVALVASPALVILLVLPIVIAVRLYLVPQAVVATGARRVAAMRASWELTRGAGVRVFAVAALSYLLFTYGAALLASPLVAAAKAADSGAVLVLFNVVGESIATPAVAIVAALLWFDLRARGGRVSAA